MKTWLIIEIARAGGFPFVELYDEKDNYIDDIIVSDLNKKDKFIKNFSYLRRFGPTEDDYITEHCDWFLYIEYDNPEDTWQRMQEMLLLREII